MEEKEKLRLKLSSSQKETVVAVLEKEEEIVEEKIENDKIKLNAQKLREQIRAEKEFKELAVKKEQAVIETPNYDLIRELPPEKKKKIYKVERVKPEEKAKPFAFNKKLKIILFSIAFIVGGAFCVSSGISLMDSVNQLNLARNEYSVSLKSLLKNISKIDSGNNMLELIETYPDELKEPSSINESTNWFDKICNFISGLFGG